MLKISVLTACAMMPGAIQALASDSDSFVAVTEKVIPTVVAVHTFFLSKPSVADARLARAETAVGQAEGSGFIVSKDGFIATNRHVIDDAYQVTVTLHDGTTLNADVVWKSSAVDVAFLKVASPEPLTAVEMPPNQRPHLGQRVLAIGNPMGLGISVSAGVVSALDRNIKQSPFDDFIQTDAAINHGSSGGPLFDERGSVVGMNSVLYSTEKEGGSQGLGFAIPGADIFFLIEQLKAKGRIACGRLGLQGQTMTPALRDAIGYPGNFGVIVASVDADSAASKAGLEQGDVLEALDEHALVDVAALNRAACLALGHFAPVRVWRAGKLLFLQAQMTEVDDPLQHSKPLEARAPRFASAEDLGIAIRPVDAQLRARLHLAPNAGGFLVETVADSSAADVSGLLPGDILLSLQHAPFQGNDFDAAYEHLGARGLHHVIVLVQRKDRQLWVALPVRIALSPKGH